MAIESTFLKDARIVIIGAGAIGSVLSYRLAQAGASVTVIERHYPGWGTTGNTFAWLNSFGKTPRDYHRLNVRSMRDHLELMRELDGDWAHFDGGLYWEHAANEAKTQKLQSTVKRLREWGYRVETVTPDQVMRELEPDLVIDPAQVNEIAYAPNEGWLNGVGLCHGALSSAIRRYGARYLSAEVVGFGGPEGTIDSVKLASGDVVHADAVINAAGPSAARVARLAGIELPMTRQPGLLIVTEPAPVALKRVVHAPQTWVHADGGGRLLLHREDYDERGASEQKPPITDPFCEQVVRNAEMLMPGLRGIHAEGVRLGVRPMPKDGHPIIGFDPEISGIYHVVMHSGVTLSAALGTLITEDLLGENPPELAPYRVERFTDRTKLNFSATNE
ncbi:MAG TPA: FAD-binding oxidoreductase [Nitrolancea sp.]|nr:FAD-binding oxidoreductase [Nitrolancea sp.]